MSSNNDQHNTCQIGAFIPQKPEDTYGDRLDEFEKLIGRNLAQVLVFFSWNDGLHHNFPHKQFEQIVNNGSVPHMVWEPSLDSMGTSVSIVDSILNGQHDEYIHAFAQEAAKFGKEFFLRPAHEMNGHWYGWSGLKNGAAKEGAEKYIKLYRYIYDIFKIENVHNISWIWSPFALSFPDEEWNEMRNYYPGDKYVDWVGLDAYNWYEYHPYQSFKDLFRKGLNQLLEVTKEKPIMIAEFGSNKFDGRDKWIEDAFTTIRENSFYKCIDAFVWFNIDKIEEEKQLNWAIHPEDIKDVNAIQRVLSHEYFSDQGDTRLKAKV